jgi:D-serine deaminase-like pyridoxal phosphate-dependent protein
MALDTSRGSGPAAGDRTTRLPMMEQLNPVHITELETPAVIVDLDVLEGNLRRLVEYGQRHGLKVRPHTKTHKIPAIARMQIDSGCHGITVAKTGEAAVMAAGGLDNILIAYPVFGAEKLKRLAALAHDRNIIVAVDSVVTARALSEAAHVAGSTVGLLVEIDVGMRRCGVSSPEDALALASEIEKLPNVKFTGITFYPGHIWKEPGDQSAGLQAVSDRIGSVLKRLSSAGISCEVISGGSTPTAYNSHLIPHVNEIRPGTYVFNDRNTLGIGACTLDECALRVIATVVSTAVPGRAIIDGGSKTFSSDRLISGDGKGFGYIIEDPSIHFESMSEEHGHLDISTSGTSFHIGDKLSVIPNHVCACVNMHDRIWYHRSGNVEGSWQVEARGKVV